MRSRSGRGARTNRTSQNHSRCVAWSSCVAGRCTFFPKVTRVLVATVVTIAQNEWTTWNFAANCCRLRLAMPIRTRLRRWKPQPQHQFVAQRVTPRWPAFRHMPAPVGERHLRPASIRLRTIARYFISHSDVTRPNPSEVTASSCRATRSHIACSIHPVASCGWTTYARKTRFTSPAGFPTTFSTRTAALLSRSGH